MNFIPKIEYIELGTGTLKTVNFSSPHDGDPFKENFITNKVVTTSNNGKRQTQFNYNKQIFSFDFNFQSEAIKNEMEDFFLNHASRGGSFKYFIHNDEPTFEVYELDEKSLKFSRPIPSGVVGQFEYDFKFKITRVL